MNTAKLEMLTRRHWRVHVGKERADIHFVPTIDAVGVFSINFKRSGPAGILFHSLTDAAWQAAHAMGYEPS